MINSTRKRKKSNTSLWIMLAAIVAIVVALLLMPSCVSNESAAETTRVKIGELAPDFTVEMLDGGRVTLAEQRGKVVLLTFWTTWCPHCHAVMERLATDVMGRFTERDFVLLPVSRGESREEVAAFCNERGYLFPVAIDPEQTAYALYAKEFVPRNFVIGRDGRIVASYVGYTPEEFEQMLGTIEKECNETNE